MSLPSEPLVPVPTSPHLVTRLFRHEVGNFLQAVYSSAALLKRQLPAEAGSLHELVAELRLHADSTRLLLDTINDFLAGRALDCAPINLGEIATGLAARAAGRNAHLAVKATPTTTQLVWGDAQRLAQAGSLLLHCACEAAHTTVEFHSTVDIVSGQAEWLVLDDGPGMTAEDQEALFDSLLLLRNQRLVQGLAPVRQIVALHGGQLSGENLPQGGYGLRLTLPVAEIAESPGKPTQ